MHSESNRIESNRTPHTSIIRHLTLLSLPPFSNDLHLFLFPLLWPHSNRNRPVFHHLSNTTSFAGCNDGLFRLVVRAQTQEFSLDSQSSGIGIDFVIESSNGLPKLGRCSLPRGVNDVYRSLGCCLDGGLIGNVGHCGNMSLVRSIDEWTKTST
jgi:hypothetical protein